MFQNIVSHLDKYDDTIFIPRLRVTITQLSKTQTQKDKNKTHDIIPFPNEKTG